MEKPLLVIRKSLISERKSVRQVEKILIDFKNKVSISEEIYFKLLIAITEAVNNAIIHGNRTSSDKIVKLIIEAYENEILVIVSDEGEGFDPDNLEDPRVPDNLLKESGRGVFIMKEISDSIDFSVTPNGTEVKMQFSLKT
ncbi:MAG: ATP-binding protein [FCB group bacterium]|jgi:serine/threonine-protein kinase RsbW